MNLKKLFIKHLFVITIISPLLLIFLYGGMVSFALKYKHKLYTERELSSYEEDLKDSSRKFLKEKSKYLASVIEFIHRKNGDDSKEELIEEIFRFVASLEYHNDFIFFYYKQGDIIYISGHPCEELAFDLVNPKREDSIVTQLMSVKESGTFITYQGTDCISATPINKIAIVQDITMSDYSIVISQKRGSSYIEKKKKIFEEKLNDELSGNLNLLLLVSFISILFSLFFSTVLNRLIVSYEKEIKNSNNVMFAQSRLAQAGELLTMIAHQWRQPIGKIASTAAGLRFQMMMGKEIERKELDIKLKDIEEYTEFVSETIDDFRLFYKPRKIKDSIPILPIIRKSIDFLGNEIDKKGIVIENNFDQDLKLLIYENELIQVMVNILQNAIEFSEKGSAILISTEIEEQVYTIRIKDEAGGISSVYIDKIFDVNFSTKSDRVLENSGLGLYVSKVIVEKHFRGNLEVISEEEKSSTFIIRLPR